jgi:hypothetical protein
MKRQIITSIEIDVPPNIIWKILTEFDRFARWNPFILSINGAAIPGTKLEVKIQTPGENAMTFRMIVLVANPERELSWLWRLLFPGIFDSEHCFEIQPLSDRRVRFIQSEKFSGLLVPLLWRSLNTRTRQGFEEMNQALKLQAEQQYTNKVS